MNDTPTPRTDAIIEQSWKSINLPDSPIPADFARQLERELTAAREEITLLKNAIANNNDAARAEYIELAEQRDRLADLVRQFIYILDITEESDGGRLFHPTNITSCRAGDLQKAGELVEALRRASR